MHPLIRDIKHSLRPEYKNYLNKFASVMDSNIALVDSVAKYIVRHKGKGLRPLLVILSAKILDKPNDNTYLVAALIEILHTATLVHDDVVDKASTRRNFPSVNAIWKNKISVLMGDYLLAKSLISATKTNSLEIMNILAVTAKRLSEGELFQIEKSRKLDITETEYFKLVSDKTAALISACCELGAMTVNSSPEQRQALRSYGENLGIAFQIKDDILDYEGKQKIIGKPVGADLKEKKITLPLILALDQAPAPERKKIIKLVRKGITRTDVKAVLNFTEHYNGLNKARQEAEKYAHRARENINVFPPSPDKDNVLKFVEYVIQRKK